VTVDIAALCFKSGNACILRGGREAVESNRALGRLVHRALRESGLSEDGVQVVPVSDRALVEEMLQAQGLIDMIIPRGGADLIRYVRDNSKVPAVEGGVGVCHTYVDASARTEMAVDVVYNAKVRRPYICNALDTLLIHSQAAPAVLPELAGRLAGAGVEMRCDNRAVSILACQDQPKLKLSPVRPEEDYGQEFLALVCAVRVVDSLEEALDHIAEYGSGHSEAIITEDYSAAMRFLQEADAAAVYVNASTQFTDGAQFGLGAEVGISTRKFHARGPMGLRELTSYKWVLLGDGHIRPA
jgi:glutamate-5-semialdehyde dehydrogenase